MHSDNTLPSLVIRPYSENTVPGMSYNAVTHKFNENKATMCANHIDVKQYYMFLLLI